MKQHITEDQLNTLSDKAKERLREWWKPRQGDLLFAENNIEVMGYDDDDEIGINSATGFYFERKACYPLLSIGQMIEFLSQYYKEIGIGFNDSGVFWRVKVGRRGCGSMLHGFGKDYDSNDSEEDDDLVTPLWQAVKEVLERDENL